MNEDTKENKIDKDYKGKKYCVDIIEQYVDDKWEKLDISLKELKELFPDLKSIHPAYSDFHNETYIRYDELGHCFIYRIDNISLSEDSVIEMNYLGGGAYGGKRPRNK